MCALYLRTVHDINVVVEMCPVGNTLCCFAEKQHLGVHLVVVVLVLAVLVMVLQLPHYHLHTSFLCHTTCSRQHVTTTAGARARRIVIIMDCVPALWE